jgi:curved DNA-binding protein CbpA
MKLESKYFDRIRIKRAGDDEAAAEAPCCQWRGCQERGLYKAPMGRGREGEYFHFCLDHVRHYNKSYNYFEGMSDGEIGAFQKEAVTGHRPTWQSRANAWAEQRMRQSKRHFDHSYSFSTDDPYEVFGESDIGGSINVARRPLRNAERRCLRTLGLDETATAEDIKANYKLLVKRHHPDSHGGDRSTEDKLREVIQAYDFLKKAGFC